MNYFLMDTDVVSHIARNSPEGRYYRSELNRLAATGRLPAMSQAVCEEILRGQQQGTPTTDDHQRQRSIAERFWQQSQGFPRSAEVLAEASKISQEANLAPGTHQHDLETAATARLYDMPLVTNDRRSFPHIQGLDVRTCDAT